MSRALRCTCQKRREQHEGVIISKVTTEITFLYYSYLKTEIKQHKNCLLNFVYQVFVLYRGLIKSRLTSCQTCIFIHVHIGFNSKINFMKIHYDVRDKNQSLQFLKRKYEQQTVLLYYLKVLLHH